jgi:DNA invertase Pin-like site-specific DNA recombinase
MASGKFVSYLRVSTARQGQSGLGLEAQRKAVDDYLNGGHWDLIQEFVEVESGKNNDRGELAKAMSLCRLRNATLVIAKIDRLSRDAHFLLGLQKAGVKFVAADMPEANEMIVGIMAVVAQAERKMISKRTKDALAAAKAKGKKLGGLRHRKDGSIVKLAAEAIAMGRAARTAKAAARAADIAPIIDDIQAGGAISLREIAAELDARGIPTARGGTWSAIQVQRVVTRQSGMI